MWQESTGKLLWYFGFSSYLCTNFGTQGVLVFYIRFNVCASASCLRSLVVFRLWLIPIQETRQSFSAVLYTISTVFTSQRLRLYIKMRVTLHSHSFLVGVARLVSRAPCLRKCARRNSDCCTANRVSVCFCRTTSWGKKARANCPCFLSGRSGETWTRGLTVPNRTRYQTALHPD